MLHIIFNNADADAITLTFATMVKNPNPES